MTLKMTIEKLAAELAQGVLAAIRSASLEEIVGDSGSNKPTAPRAVSVVGAKPRRRKASRGRRTTADFDATIGLIVAELKKHTKTGLRSEHLQKSLKLGKRDIAPALVKALAAKKVRKTGERRATNYFAA